MFGHPSLISMMSLLSFFPVATHQRVNEDPQSVEYFEGIEIRKYFHVD